MLTLDNKMNIRESAIKRIKLLNRHFSPTPDFHREMGKCTFNFELAASVVHKLRPEEHYQTIDAMESLTEGSYRGVKPKDDLRIETNKLCKALLNKLISNKVLTAQRVFDDPDFLNRCTMQIGFYSAAV